MTDHLQTKKKKNAMLANPRSGFMTDYFHKLGTVRAEYDLTIYECTHAYHTVLHKHSFCSIDYTTNV
jgi:hypothetical protein